MILQPFLVSPVLMEPSSTALKGFVGGESGATGLSPTYAPFIYNGALYQVLQGAGNVFSFTPTGGIFVYKSTDNGATWTALDALNGPSRADPDPTAGFFWDGNQTVIVAFNPTGGADLGITGPIHLQNFNLATGTWGPVYATAGAPAIYEVAQCFLRPDGSILVLAAPNISGGSVVNLSAYIFSGGVWSTSFAVDANMTAGFTSNGTAACVMDPATGNIHVFGISQNGGHVSELWYQLVLANNTLGTFAVIQTGSPTNLPGLSGFYQPAISGNNVIIGLVDSTDSYVTIVAGTPLSAPVFTALGAPGIDPGGPPVGFQLLGPPVLAVDATGIYAAYVIRQGDTNVQIRLVGNPNVATPLVGWGTGGGAGILAFNPVTAPPGFRSDGIGFLGIARQNGNLLSGINTPAAPDPAEPTQYWMGTLAAPPPPPPPTNIANAIAGGIPYGVPGCRKKNIWDECMELEKLKLQNIQFPPLCSIPDEFKNWLPWDEDFGTNAIPEGAVPFREVHGIVTPLPAAGDQIVLTSRVPYGYDGLLAGIYNFYSGNGFLQGSGDILWRIKLNQHYLQDLGNIQFTLGSPVSPCPLTEGQILLSGQTMRYIVNVPNLSGLIQVGASQIVCGLVGFWWPR